MHHIL